MSIVPKKPLLQMQAVIEWHWKSFEELTAAELYSVFEARQAVFVVEQNCAYQDADGLDRSAWHLFACQNNHARDRHQILAYLRVVRPGCMYTEPSIGRVLTSKDARRSGLGKLLMRRAIEHIHNEFPGANIRISAQQYLQAFYTEFGFKAVSEPYLEDGIPHLEMLRKI